MKRELRRFAALLVGLAPCPLHSLVAQEVDVLRGHVTGLDSVPIAFARVIATAMSTHVSRTVRTDTKGRYTLTFPNGDGDYLVSVVAMGFAPKQFQLKRVADEDILIGDAQLGPAVTMLEAVQVAGGRKRPPRDRGNEADVSGSERTAAEEAVAFGDQGDLAAMAAAIPGLRLVPGTNGDPSGFSAFGLGADENNTTLNGALFGGNSLPLDARVTSSVALSPYDVSRGGFSGAQRTVRTTPGSNYLLHTGTLLFNTPSLQWTDRAGQAWGRRFSMYTASEGISGPIAINKAFYSVAYQIGRRASDVRSLLNTDPTQLGASGLAADSTRRLLQTLDALGIPTSGALAPSQRLADEASVIGSFDVAPPAAAGGTAMNLTVSSAWNRTNPIGLGATSLPSFGGKRSNWNIGGQWRHSTYFDIGVLSESTVSMSIARNAGTPFLTMPSGRVLIASLLPDSTQGIAIVDFAGDVALATMSRSETASATNQLSWFSANSRHRVKLGTEVHRDRFAQSASANTFGTFTFTSLADLAQGRAASFSRQIGNPTIGADAWLGAVSLGDSYRPHRDFQLQVGVRIDGNRFDTAPTRNPALDSAFDVRNDVAPNRWHVSPRLGFSWVYGTAPTIKAFDGAFRGPRAVVRGGVGVFQNAPAASLLTGALSSTGLSDAVQYVSCTGLAVPVATWSAYRTSPSSIPTQCVDEVSAFGSVAPNVVLFSKHYAAPRSIRANLQWRGVSLGNRVMLMIDATYSLNLNRPSVVDLNFVPEPRFALAAEGGRLVFTSAEHIDPATGALAVRDAQLSSRFNRVSERQSDLVSTARQVTLSLSPASHNLLWSWNVVYVNSSLRDQARGFGEATAGNPLRVEWARSAWSARHQIQYSLGYNWLDLVRLNWTGTLMSGTPFTPVVHGDVNGDGYSNDRAFIVNPASAIDPVVGAGMTRLLTQASATVRRCLVRQMGRIAARNSCEGPWTHAALFTLSLNPLKLGLPQRAVVSVQVSNPLGAADLVLHGEKHLRGWGQTPILDPVLYSVRGFDPTAREFQYDVNTRFGSANPAFSTLRQPVSVTLRMQLQLGPSREQQALDRSLDRGRRLEGQKMSQRALRLLLAGGVTNPMTAILSQSDELALTAVQADSLSEMNRRYVDRVQAIWVPLSASFAALPDLYSRREIHAQYQRARESVVDLLLALAPQVVSLLSPAQRRLLPRAVADYLDPRYLRSIRSTTVGDPSGIFTFY